MKKVEKYTLIFNLVYGQKEFNDFISNFDLGLNGMYTTERIKIETTSFPDNTYLRKLRIGIKRICKQQGLEFKEFKLTEQINE